MGKHLLFNGQYEVEDRQHRPGWLWGMLHALDYHHWQYVKKLQKLLYNRKHHPRRRRLRCKQFLFIPLTLSECLLLHIVFFWQEWCLVTSSVENYFRSVYCGSFFRRRVTSVSIFRDLLMLQVVQLQRPSLLPMMLEKNRNKLMLKRSICW